MTEITDAIKKAVASHEPSKAGCIQWYVDENVIDCYADEFWDVVGKAILTYWFQSATPYGDVMTQGISKHWHDKLMAILANSVIWPEPLAKQFYDLLFEMRKASDPK